MMHTRKAVTEREAAEYTGMSRSFLRQSRMDGIREGRTPGPPFVKIGRAVRYLVEDLDAWLVRYRCALRQAGER
jgi:predicted DNA-binding transcriptional regulator AlpA